MVMSRNERVATRYKLQPWDLNLNSPLERRESPWKGKKKEGKEKQLVVIIFLDQLRTRVQKFRFKESHHTTSSSCCAKFFASSSAKKKRNIIYIYIFSQNMILFIHDVLIMIRFDSVEHVTGITLASIWIDVVVAQYVRSFASVFLSTPSLRRRDESSPCGRSKGRDEHKGSRPRATSR